MRIKITPARLKGKIQAPASKSYAHRLIILSCLSGKTVTVKNVGESDDVIATVNCMKSLGADCETVGGDFTVKSFKKKKSAVIDCGESGSTLRFLLPVCAALNIKTKITGSEKLLSRPSEELINALNVKGADIKDFTVNGKITAGRYEIDASVSSQYVSGLMIALALLKGSSELIITGKKVSENYLNITESVLKDFGVEILKTESGYLIKGGITAKDVYFNEGDFSGAAFMLSAGAIGGRVSVSGLNLNSEQGDRKIVDILKEFGAVIRADEKGITASKSSLKGINVDCENTPDLAQIISVVAAFSSGKTTITGISRLRYKESDRIAAITDMLSAAGVKWQADGDSIEIFGGEVSGGKFDSKNDHRTAMSAAILAANASGESFIDCAESVKKSYPDFYKDYIKLGGKTDVDI